MTEIIDHPVHFTVLDDGTHLAASIQRPWFAVSAATYEEARNKAIRALSCYEGRDTTVRPHRQSNTFKSFSAVRVENLTATAEACA